MLSVRQIWSPVVFKPTEWWQISTVTVLSPCDGIDMSLRHPVLHIPVAPPPFIFRIIAFTATVVAYVTVQEYDTVDFRTLDSILICSMTIAYSHY